MLKIDPLKIFSNLFRSFAPVKKKTDQCQAIRREIIANPANGELYYKLGCEYQKRHKLFESIALYRTAISFACRSPQVIISLAQSYIEIGLFDYAFEQLNKVLGSQASGFHKLLEACYDNQEIRENSWQLEYIGYGKYQRLRLLSERIDATGQNNLKVADIGGGQGELAVFIPKHNYVMIEPSVTGIISPGLPFRKNEFDIVICADVLEHIPKQKRESFVLEMINLAKSKVLFTAPFGQENRNMDELYWKLTQNPWTEEHLSHEYSTVDEMAKILEKQNTTYKIFPISLLPVHFAMGYLNYYLMRENKQLMTKVNQFFNESYSHLVRKDPSYGYLFEITL